MAGTTCLALDGSLVTFDGSLGQVASWVSVVEVLVRRAGGERTVELIAGDRENARWAATEVVGLELTESFSCQGGQLHVGSSSTEGADGSTSPLLFGAWEGERRSIGVPYHWSTQSAAMVALFEAFEIDEGDDGVAIRPRDRTVAITDIPQPPSVALRVEDLGTIEAYPATRQSIKAVPKWAGTRTAGGELFLGGQAGSEYFLLAGRSALATVSPQAGVSLETVIEAFDSLVVDWRPPARG